MRQEQAGLAHSRVGAAASGCLMEVEQLLIMGHVTLYAHEAATVLACMPADGLLSPSAFDVFVSP